MLPPSRKFKITLPFIILMTLSSFWSSAPLSPLYGKVSKPKFVFSTSEESFKSDVLKSEQPVLVEFWAPWCGPCRIFGPIVDEVAESYGGRLKVARINVDQNQKLARGYRIRSIPTTLFFIKGKQVKIWVGLVPKERLKADINRLLKTKR
jgi:thioredoxin 1